MQVGISHLIGSGNVLVVGHKIDRLGDLSTAMKVVEVLKRLGGIPANQIIVATNSQQDYRRYFDPENQHQVIGYEKIDGLEEVRLAVIAPFERGILGPELVCNGYPVLMLSEYGRPLAGIPDMVNGLAVEYLCGLSSEDRETLGLWIDPELKKWAQLENEVKLQACDQIEKELDEDLQRALGCGTSRSLYVGYGANRHVKECWVEAICKADHEKDQDLVFVLPGQDLSDWCAKLSRLPDVSHISVIQRQDNGKISERANVTLSESGKRVTLLSGYFSFHELHRLWRLCERDVLVAGDQSLSEAISANKCWFWEEYDHKMEMGVQLRNLLRVREEPRQSVVEPHATSTRTMEAAIHRFREGQYATVDERHQSLWEEQDCTFKILDKAKELLDSFNSCPMPVDLREKKEFDPLQLTTGVTYLINLNQVGSLELPHGEKVRSLRPELSHLLFECEMGNTDYFLRVHK